MNVTFKVLGWFASTFGELIWDVILIVLLIGLITGAALAVLIATGRLLGPGTRFTGLAARWDAVLWGGRLRDFLARQHKPGSQPDQPAPAASAESETPMTTPDTTPGTTPHRDRWTVLRFIWAWYVAEIKALPATLLAFTGILVRFTVALVAFQAFLGTTPAHHHPYRLDSAALFALLIYYLADQVHITIWWAKRNPAQKNRDKIGLRDDCAACGRYGEHRLIGRLLGTFNWPVPPYVLILSEDGYRVHAKCNEPYDTLDDKVYFGSEYPVPIDTGTPDVVPDSWDTRYPGRAGTGGGKSPAPAFGTGINPRQRLDTSIPSPHKDDGEAGH